MARIRTIKPDFFRSPDTAKVDFPVRLFYQALWCWADDFGIGETNLNGLLGFAFPDEDEFTAQDVRRFCAEVAAHFGARFYTVRGRHYYAIPSWEKHQKLERRTDRRKNPTPDDPAAVPDLRFHPCADSAPEVPRRNGAETALEREGEQGNRGTEQPPYPPNREIEVLEPLPAKTKDGAEIARQKFAAAPVCASPLARDVATAYNNSLNTPLEAKVLHQVATEIDGCLRSQIPPHAIAAGIDLWTRSDSWAPSQIPKFVHKANNRGRGSGVGKATEKALDYETAAQQLINALETP